MGIDELVVCEAALGEKKGCGSVRKCKELPAALPGFWQHHTASLCLQDSCREFCHGIPGETQGRQCLELFTGGLGCLTTQCPLQAAKEMSQWLSSSRIIVPHGQQSLDGWCIALHCHHLRRGWESSGSSLGTGSGMWLQSPAWLQSRSKTCSLSKGW